MSESEILDLIEAHIGQRPQLSPESHLPLDLHLQRMLLPTIGQQATYWWEEGKLVGLNLSDLKLKEEQLGFLEQTGFQDLQALNLSLNQLSTWTIPAQLRQLRYLELSENPQLQEVHFPRTLGQLERLDLSKCDLRKLELPEGMTSLRILMLSGNQHLQQLNIAVPLPGLQYLYAGECGLQRLRFGQEMKRLRYLFLHNNQLKGIDRGVRTHFPELVHLELKENQFEQIGKRFLNPFPELLNLSLEGNPLPESIRSNLSGSPVEQLAFLRRYTEELQEGQAENHECKILLLGNGGVGKSCFLRRLVHKEFEPDWKSTHGIVIQERYVGDEETVKFVEPYVYNIWDFAGQDIYHATHRLFMQANALYLILWDKETEASEFSELKEQGVLRKYENYSLDYWLHYAEKRGKGSPAIVVQTKRDRDGIQGLAHIQSTYHPDFLIDCRQIESETEGIYDNGYYDLLSSMRRAVVKMKAKEQIPQLWDDVRTKVRALKEAGKNWLTLEEFDQLAVGYQAPMDILRWLTQSGVVFFQEGLFQGIILDQMWAIRAIYALFDREKHYYELIELKEGTILGKYLEEQVWKAYAPFERELFISFLLSCEMCFETSEIPDLPFAERSFVAPQLLPEKSKEVEDHWIGREQLHMRFLNDHFHYGIIQSFIVRTHYLSSPLEGSRKIWKMGIRLLHGNQQAQVEAHEKRIEIRATRNGRALLGKIRLELEKLRDSEGDALVSVDGKHYVNWKQLEAADADPKETHIVDVDGKPHEIKSFAPFLGRQHGIRGDKISREFDLFSSSLEGLPLRKKIQLLIFQGQTDLALKDLYQVTDARENETKNNQVAILSQRFQENEAGKISGTSSSDAYLREKARIHQLMLELAGKLAQHSQK